MLLVTSAFAVVGDEVDEEEFGDLEDDDAFRRLPFIEDPDDPDDNEGVNIAAESL